MFGHNEIVGKKFFAESPKAIAGKLLVTSLFHTIQGEGPFAGRPAAFVRLAKCNLQCDFCDTYFDSGDWLTAEEILERLEVLWWPHPGPDLLVVTGGEPTLQDASLRGLLHAAVGRGRFKDAQIESNGLMCSGPWPHGAVHVVSPKCVGNPPHYSEPPRASLMTADCLKFVVSADAASPYHSVPAWALDWRASMRREVFVSPMAEYNCEPELTRATYLSRSAPSIAKRSVAERVSFWEPGLLDLEKCQRNHEHAAELAMQYGLRLSIQMQLLANLP